MAIAEIVRHNLAYQRPYWVPVAVAIVLKPDFEPVFTRGGQRSVGTVVGVAVRLRYLHSGPMTDGYR
jgi:uncharacterized membrane protein YccC